MLSGSQAIPLNTYVKWDSVAASHKVQQGVSLFQDYISRLGKAKMGQCGPVRCRSTLKRMDTWDERPLRSCCAIAAHRVYVCRSVMASRSSPESIEDLSF